jgi:hypothetical protein
MQRSIALGKASWSVLKSDRSLTSFPIFSGLASIVIVAVMAGLAWVTKGASTTDAAGHTHYSASVATFVVAGVGYVSLAFVQNYFLAGLVACANERLCGRPTSVRDGLNVATARSGRLLPWAVVSALVSWILRSLEQRAGLVGRLVVGALGFAWSVVTFLTVPVIVFEDVGVTTALKRSGALLKQTWGENIFAQLGLGLLALPLILLGVAVGVLAALTNIVVIQVAGLALAVAIFVATAVLLFALGGIYRTALYRYAVDGSVPAAFAGADLEHAFAPRTGLSRRF